MPGLAAWYYRPCRVVQDLASELDLFATCIEMAAVGSRPIGPTTATRSRRSSAARVPLTQRGLLRRRRSGHGRAPGAVEAAPEDHRRGVRPDEITDSVAPFAVQHAGLVIDRGDPVPRDFPGVKNHHVDVVELVGRKSFQGLEVLPPRDERTFLHRHGLSRGRIDALGDTLEHVMIELVRRAPLVARRPFTKSCSKVQRPAAGGVRAPWPYDCTAMEPRIHDSRSQEPMRVLVIRRP